MTSVTLRELRRAFGSFMTGVTVVTTLDTDGTPAGFTANSFASVSLDPPLLLVCPGKSLSSYRTFSSCPRFTVNVLAEGQENVSNTFATVKGDRFAQTAHYFDAFGLPLIKGAAAQFSCRTHRVLEAGDHCILIGQVEDFSHEDLRGLGFAGGRYFSLGLERSALEPAARTVACGAVIECDGQILLDTSERGLRPPQVVLTDRQNVRAGLQRGLAERGIHVSLGAAYSVYDDDRNHHVYVLARAKRCTPGAGLECVAVEELSTRTYATSSIASMMSRYALESRTRDFSLYFGDAEKGDVHGFSERI